MTATLVPTQRGGDVTLTVTRRVHPPLLQQDPHLRSTIRSQMRHEIISALAERSGLPFHRAITNIVRWEEEERKHGPDPFLASTGDQGVVVLVTRCTVRHVEYVQEG